MSVSNFEQFVKCSSCVPGSESHFAQFVKCSSCVPGSVSHFEQFVKKKRCLTYITCLSILYVDEQCSDLIQLLSIHARHVNTASTFQVDQ